MYDLLTQLIHNNTQWLLHKYVLTDMLLALLVSRTKMKLGTKCVYT